MEGNNKKRRIMFLRGEGVNMLKRARRRKKLFPFMAAENCWESSRIKFLFELIDKPQWRSHFK
jgi:hypothetical protein